MDKNDMELRKTIRTLANPCKEDGEFTGAAK
jgi:hypothetical protein